MASGLRFADQPKLNLADDVQQKIRANRISSRLCGGTHAGRLTSLDPKRIDGVQVRRLASGTVAEQHPDAAGNHERNRYSHPGNTERNDTLSQSPDQPDQSKGSHYPDHGPSKTDKECLQQELEPDLIRSRAQCLPDSNFVRSLGDIDKHDIHNARSGSDKSQDGNPATYGAQSDRNVICRVKKRRQILDGVTRFLPVTALQQAVQLLSQIGYFGRGCRLRIEHLKEVLACNGLDQGERDEQRVVLYLGLSKGGHSLFEGSNDGATKLFEVNVVAHRGFEAKGGLGHVVRDQTNLEVGQEVFYIEVSARGNLQIADLLKILRDANQPRMELSAPKLKADWNVVGTGNGADCREVLAYGREILWCQLVV